MNPSDLHDLTLYELLRLFPGTITELGAKLGLRRREVWALTTAEAKILPLGHLLKLKAELVRHEKAVAALNFVELWKQARDARIARLSLDKVATKRTKAEQRARR